MFYLTYNVQRSGKICSNTKTSKKKKIQILSPQFRCTKTFTDIENVWANFIFSLGIVKEFFILQMVVETLFKHHTLWESVIQYNKTDTIFGISNQI